MFGTNCKNRVQVLVCSMLIYHLPIYKKAEIECISSLQSFKLHRAHFI